MKKQEISWSIICLKERKSYSIYICSQGNAVMMRVIVILNIAQEMFKYVQLPCYQEHTSSFYIKGVATEGRNHKAQFGRIISRSRFTSFWSKRGWQLQQSWETPKSCLCNRDLGSISPVSGHYYRKAQEKNGKLSK